MGKCSYSSPCKYPVFVAPFIEGAIFSLTYVFGIFVKKSGDGSCVGLYVGPLSIPLFYISDFVPAPICLS